MLRAPFIEGPRRGRSEPRARDLLATPAQSLASGGPRTV